MPALLSAKLGLVSGKASLGPGGGRQADVETSAGDPDQRQEFGQIITSLCVGQTAAGQCGQSEKTLF